MKIATATRASRLVDPLDEGRTEGLSLSRRSMTDASHDCSLTPISAACASARTVVYRHCRPARTYRALSQRADALRHLARLLLRQPSGRFRPSTCRTVVPPLSRMRVSRAGFCPRPIRRVRSRFSRRLSSRPAPRERRCFTATSPTRSSARRSSGHGTLSSAARADPPRRTRSGRSRDYGKLGARWRLLARRQRAHRRR